MLRNFGILKMRLWRPTRSDQYSTGPREVIFTANATSKIGRAKSNAATMTSVKSNSRFITSLPSHEALALAHRPKLGPS